MVDVIYVNIEPLYFEDAIHIILIHKIVLHIEHYSKPCYLKLISLFYLYFLKKEEKKEQANHF